MVDKTQRRLAAILAADVAGYTRLVELDTDGTVAAWKSARDNVIKPLVDKKSGRIIKFTGDGFLVEFPSVQDAVACAITLQEELRSSSLNFRMGINVGDITDDGGDVHGEGVNIAARLEALAEPGGICISGDVYNQVRNRIDAVFTDMGEQEVKHVSRPVSVFAISSTQQKTSDHLTSSPPALPDKPSIAILPFDNLSNDPEQEYFSDGITESIILNLALFPGLNVKSRNTSFAFKQQLKNLGEISHELNVDYIVEGSIRKSQEKIRITVQLIEAGSGNQVWGKRYDSELDDLFSLEEDLSRTIAATITGQIGSDQQQIAISKGAKHLRSYDLLLSGIYYFYRFNRQDNTTAIENLNQCLMQDPNNVRAHAMIFESHVLNYLERWTPDYRSSFNLAEEHIRKALLLGPEIGLVQVMYGECLTFKGELEKAMEHLDKALEINPNDPDALTTKALNLMLQGEFVSALDAAKRACQLDPYHPWAEWEMATTQYFCGSYQSASETISKSRTSPVFMQLINVASNVKLGRDNRARDGLQTFLKNCRKDMLSMPRTLEEWLLYTRENYPFVDSNINQDLIDCLLVAGLESNLQ